MMWNSIANFKENLNKIALDVHDDDDDELSMYDSSHHDENSFSARKFSHSKSPTQSPITNGFDSPHNPEIEQYKAEIKRLQESEAEIKALSVNYAALLKEKEDRISKLNEDNGSLKQNLQTLNASRNTLKGNDQSPNRQNRGNGRTRVFGSPTQNGLSNGNRSSEKELADLLEEKSKSLEAIQATHELQTKELQIELAKEREKLANLQVLLQEDQKTKESIQNELNLLKRDKDKSFTEMSKIQDELNKKTAEINRLRIELQRRGDEGTKESNDSFESLKRVISTLQEENTHLKEKKSTESFAGKEQMEKDLTQMRKERDKASQELKRLKQHLLEKASEESEKMDEDSKLIEELREKNDYQRAQILHLEKALKQAISGQEEAKFSNTNEIKKSKETIEELNRKLATCTHSIEAKNVEILNLQSALGQYYAEIEAKERLWDELTIVKEESAKLSNLLKNAHEEVEISKKEKEELLSKISLYERSLNEGQNRVKKIEEDNEKLRRALEQSMTRLNRMSMDSDYYVDRRIVIKLLVTYFQRNHSKEVLDLMVRMLGFSDEDKQRIGVAQQGIAGAGKGVVRGVLGLPGRLVGGFMGGGGGASGGAPPSSSSDNQSFAEMWVDFLLKETEEREKRESEAAANRAKADQYRGAPDSTNTSPLYRGNMHSDSEFSTVPLSESNAQISRLPLR